MARNVIVSVAGGSKQVIDNASITTIGQLKAFMNVPKYAAKVNEEPEGDGYELQEGDFVALAEAVKGGQI